MANTSELLDLAGKHLLKNYKQPQMVLTRGEGCRVWDTEGRCYLDMYAGIAVCALGHAHPALVKAITAQASRLNHVANLYYNDRQIELAAELARRTGLDRVFFCNSGAEANEGALKLARRYHYGRGDTERSGAIATWGSFHGRTLGAVALTGKRAYWEGFGPRLGDISHVPYGDLEAMQRRANDRTAAIFIEPVQGEGGVLPAPKGYLAGLRELCDKVGALLVVDEIQIGVGRSGSFLAVQREGVSPDVVTLAKALGGGVPIGCFVAREKYADALPPGTHGSTFGGNPFAAAVALALLETFDREGILAKVEQRSEYFMHKLSELGQRYPARVEAARGLGLLCGLVLREGTDPRMVMERMRDRGVLIATAGERVLRFAPALIVTEAELDEALEALDNVLSGLPELQGPEGGKGDNGGKGGVGGAR